MSLFSLLVTRSTVCIAKLYGVKSIDRNDSCWMHWGIRRWLTANVFIGDGWNTHIKISQKPDTLCEFENHFPSIFSRSENPLFSLPIQFQRRHREKIEFHPDLDSINIWFHPTPSLRLGFILSFLFTENSKQFIWTVFVCISEGELKIVSAV